MFKFKLLKLIDDKLNTIFEGENRCWPSIECLKHKSNCINLHEKNFDNFQLFRCYFEGIKVYINSF
jgi:hypothetical protein